MQVTLEIERNNESILPSTEDLNHQIELIMATSEDLHQEMINLRRKKIRLAKEKVNFACLAESTAMSEETQQQTLKCCLREHNKLLTDLHDKMTEISMELDYLAHKTKLIDMQIRLLEVGK